MQGTLLTLAMPICFTTTRASRMRWTRTNRPGSLLHLPRANFGQSLTSESSLSLLGKLIHLVRNMNVWMPRWFISLTLAVNLASADKPINSNQSSVLGNNKNQQNAMGEDRSNREPTVSAAAKLLLRAVRESADAFPPLKSLAGGLCFIMENFEVRIASVLNPRYNVYDHFSEHKRTGKR